eukprot:m.116240 g.116240  ORF g.116240 m.116240 type:complete len:503 (-) comp28488_c0_seq2:141-1649(-)
MGHVVCGTALHKHCAAFRGSTSSACVSCVQSVQGTNCTSAMRSDFCGGCAPQFNFQWIDQLAPNPTNRTINTDVMDLGCFDYELTNETQPYATMMDAFRMSNCSHHVMAAFLTSVGYLVRDPENNGAQDYDPIHGASVEFAVTCCKTFESAPQCGGRSLRPMWQLVKKLTDCQSDKMVSAMAEVGISAPDVDPNNPFGVSYVLDLRKVSTIAEPLVGVLMKEEYGATLRYLLGLTLAAAFKHGCGTSWFVPGADQMYSEVVRVQGDFYFPATNPDPFSLTGSCGKAETSEVMRLGVCAKVIKFLYDNANISGMSILGCTVDCTGSHLDSVGGAFVSIVIPIVEIDTRSTGFSPQNGGVSDAVAKLNKDGFNITDDLKQTVGVGFQFVSRLLGSDDLFSVINWRESDTKVESKIVFDVLPNMTEAELAYKVPKTPSKPATSNKTAVVVGVSASVVLLLAGVLIGLSVQFKKSAVPANSTAITNNHEYEDDSEPVTNEDNTSSA